MLLCGAISITQQYQPTCSLYIHVTSKCSAIQSLIIVLFVDKLQCTSMQWTECPGHAMCCHCRRWTSCNSVADLPCVLSPAAQATAEQRLQQLATCLPQDLRSASIKTPFSNPGSMRMHDWFVMAGPIGEDTTHIYPCDTWNACT
jgi:hypothetical protein